MDMRRLVRYLKSRKNELVRRIGRHPSFISVKKGENMNDQEIREKKQAARQAEHERKEKQKQLQRQRTRIYNEMVAYQKVNLKRIKRPPQGAFISLQNINKIYSNKVQAVFNLNLDIKEHEFIVLVGPSGCGKSTTLRMIAGLEDITAGDFYIDGVYANEVHPKDRDIAMVFQSYALYPHMTVAGNMAFGIQIKKVPVLKTDENGQPVLTINKKAIRIYRDQIKTLSAYLAEAKEDREGIEREIAELQEKIAFLEKTPMETYVLRHLPKEEIRDRVMNAANILQIEDYLDRKPKALSGGQCQRVALGRAIVKKAKVFLMDEPLSNLDAKLRVQMRSEIIKLHNSLNATTIYVTHDQTEAMTMATRIVVMNRGRVQQIGTPLEIYSHPANTFVASFIGSPAMNFLNVIYENGTVEFANGLRMTLPEDKKNAVEAYYAGIVDTLRRELAEFDDAFIERKEALSRIEKLKDDPEKQDLLEKEREQLRLIEESSADRMALIDSIEKLSAPGQSERREMIFGIRPEDIYEEEKAPDGEPLSAPYHTKVMLAELLGKEYYIHTEFAGSEIVSEIHTKKLVSAGDDINLVFDMESVHLFDPITTKAV